MLNPKNLKPGKEQHEKYKAPSGKMMVQYDYRNLDGTAPPGARRSRVKRGGFFSLKEYENWLCKHCEHYKGMDDKMVTRCGNKKWAKHFERDKDYLLHYATARPYWCKVEVDF